MRHIFISAALVALAEATLLFGAEPVKVGIYSRALGGRAMHQALLKQKELKPSLFSEFKPESMRQFDVLVIGGTSLDQPAQLKTIRLFLACGGGVVFNHHSCGRGKPETLFPSVVAKVVDRRADTVLVVKDPTHPVAAGLPAQFEHGYNDHLYLLAGPNGHTVLEDRASSPVVVVGEVEGGRVVFNGSLPGYRYDLATYAQGEAEPTGGELQLLINAVRWAGDGRASALPEQEFLQRKEQVERAMKLADLEKLLPTADWFGTEMLTGSYLPSQPVNELGGRFFITYDTMSWRGYSLKKISSEKNLEFLRQRLHLDVLHLKWLGVTDIIYWTDVSGNRVWRDHTDVPDSDLLCQGVDQLAELIKAATKEGLNVWAAWHSCFREENRATFQGYAEKYCAKDANGQFYKYGGKECVEDLVGQAYRERCYRFLDEYAAKYKPMGNFKGLAVYDEIWFTYADFHGDDLAAFENFCMERFGERPPADMGERLAKQRQWNDLSDVWRRRYILFKQNVVTSFWRDLVQYAHRKGLEIGIELFSTAAYADGWCWGMDSVELYRLGADLYVDHTSESASSSYPKAMRWTHMYAPWGFYNTHCLHGAPGGIYFTFNTLWRLITYANNPALTREFARHVHLLRQWANARPLGRVAFLHNQEALQMLLADPRVQLNRDTALFNAIQRSQDADFIFTRAHERYGEFALLVATPCSVRGLSDELYAQLRRFVENGGVILSVNADWSIARPDLTQERDITAEFVGAAYGADISKEPANFKIADTEISLPAGTPRRRVNLSEGVRVLANFSTGAPAVTEKQIGKGRVIALHFGADVEIEKNQNPALMTWIRSLARELSSPPIWAEGEGFRMISTLRKGNWVAVALYPDKTPSVATLHIDTQALGIPKDGFRMLMLGKRMEISRPGDWWGERGFWRTEELKKGFRVTLVADDDVNKPLPEKFDLSDFTGKDGKWAAEYIENVTRDWWNSNTRGRRKRNYAHEIVVIAPGDEPVMPAR